ncbi:nanos homolog 3-like [Galendromus occidentalis]|uniref:Nanos homolog 3-like n=1 Tax=Galendromus occidentalis TaxID=34638 RepID=A0AAJ6VX87_9ACAR|nr:nanos homolog 3-like [Galendromus occidentalis]
MDRFNFANASDSTRAAEILKSQLGTLQSLTRKSPGKAREDSAVDGPPLEQRVPRSIDDSGRADPFCVFCKKNGAPKAVYRSHTVKDNRGSVVCPVLRKFNCHHCNNGGGDQAHTANFCPKKREVYLNSFLKNKDEP